VPDFNLFVVKVSDSLFLYTSYKPKAGVPMNLFVSYIFYNKLSKAFSNFSNSLLILHVLIKLDLHPKYSNNNLDL
jgi:hypothetical protein